MKIILRGMGIGWKPVINGGQKYYQIKIKNEEV
jgi:hypothetical protein